MSDLAYYVICGILTLGVLAGIAMMSRVQLAVRGNALSALCTAAAILCTLYRYQILSDAALWVCLGVGTAIGLAAAWRVQMISMPQAVAMLNGFGGAASAIVGALTLGVSGDAFTNTTAVLAVTVGLATFTGSLVAAGKLQRLLSQKSVLLPNHGLLTNGCLLLTLFSMVAAIFTAGGGLYATAVVGALASALFGVFFSIRVGGADMPITISLLNSLSGVAGSIAGMAIGDPLLVAIGGIVGASGLLLTQIMCRAMNRSLPDILLGKTSAEKKKPASSATGGAVFDKASAEKRKDSAPPIESAAAILKNAQRVILVPGYGMAVAQAQNLVKQLADKLEADGKEVLYAIHPVAGRMPGHMNVLLAEVDVPYDQLLEMEEVNPRFEGCDAAVVIGANDVMNSAANTAVDTPIYGMPVLDVEKARHVIVCNYDLQPGYAGVENPIYQRENTTLLCGDAKDTLASLLTAVSFTVDSH